MQAGRVTKPATMAEFVAVAEAGWKLHHELSLQAAFFQLQAESTAVLSGRCTYFKRTIADPSLRLLCYVTS